MAKRELEIVEVKFYKEPKEQAEARQKEVMYLIGKAFYNSALKELKAQKEKQKNKELNKC